MPERRQYGLFRNQRYLKGRFPLRDQTDSISELAYYRGDTIRFEVQVFDEFDQPHNVDDHDIVMTIRCEEWSDEILFQANLEEDPTAVEVLNAPEGVIQITLDPEFTRTLEPRGYIFDIQLTRQSDSFVQTVVREVFTILRDITTS